MDYSTLGFPVHHQLPELAKTRVHQVSDAIQPSHSLSSPSPPAFNLSQYFERFSFPSRLFKLWFWRRLLRVPWTARRSNQFILKEISPEYSMEGLMLKLKLQYFGHLKRRTDSLEKTLMLGKIEGRRRMG